MLGRLVFLFAVGTVVLVTVTDGLRMIAPTRCSLGSMGTCRRFPKKSCPPGSTCKYRSWFSGDCCRDKPTIPECTECGGIVNKPCAPGFECEYKSPGNLGCCRKSTGDCGGVVGKQCPNGYSCKYSKWSTAGVCYKSTTPIPVCTLCGGIVNKPCAPGFECEYKSPGNLGCCRKSTDVICPGLGKYKGQCGGKKGLTCGSGSSCLLPDGIVDGLGKCCTPKGECPQASGMPGICVFDPLKNCLGDEFCKKGSLCCSEGCGKVCKEALLPGTY